MSPDRIARLRAVGVIEQDPFPEARAPGAPGKNGRSRPVGQGIPHDRRKERDPSVLSSNEESGVGVKVVLMETEGANSV